MQTNRNEKISFFDGIIGYSDIKKEFVKSLDAWSPVSIYYVDLECGMSKFLKQIRNHFEEESSFIDASYESKAGIFQILYAKRPKYVLLDEIDKHCGQDQSISAEENDEKQIWTNLRLTVI